MMDIPVPTLDQITGRTVMEKMRTLAKAFIAFANEIKDNVYTEEEVREYVTSVLLNYYTKEEVDEAIASIDLSDFYTKSETDGMLDLKRNVADSYDKTEIDTKDTALGNRIDSCEDSISDLETNKQDVLIPVAPIEIDENNNISVDNQKVLVSGKDHESYFKIKGSFTGQELRIVNDFSLTSTYMLLAYNGILFRKLNNSDTAYISKASLQITDHTSISQPVLSISLNQTTSGSTNQKVLELISIKDSSNNYWGFNGRLNAPSGTSGKANGLFLKYSDSGETMILGTLQMTNRKFTTFVNGIKITPDSINTISNAIETPIATVKDFPTGKNLTDTVTFQDLVDLGLIKAPTTP